MKPVIGAKINNKDDQDSLDTKSLGSKLIVLTNCSEYSSVVAIDVIMISTCVCNTTRLFSQSLSTDCTTLVGDLYQQGAYRGKSMTVGVHLSGCMTR